MRPDRRPGAGCRCPCTETADLDRSQPGGAVAVLAAARLADQGASQLQVVTFGAPAVGNDALMRLTAGASGWTASSWRAIPVEKAVQAVSRTYEQFPDKTVWQAAPTTRRFAHDIAGYADAALRRYYDAKTAYETYLGHAVPDDGGRPFGSPVWVPPLSLTLDEALQADTPYLERAADDQLGYRLHPVFARRTVPGRSPAPGPAARLQRGPAPPVPGAAPQGKRI